MLPTIAVLLATCLQGCDLEETCSESAVKTWCTSTSEGLSSVKACKCYEREGYAGLAKRCRAKQCEVLSRVCLETAPADVKPVLGIVEVGMQKQEPSDPPGSLEKALLDLMKMIDQAGVPCSHEDAADLWFQQLLRDNERSQQLKNLVEVLGNPTELEPLKRRLVPATAPQAANVVAQKAADASEREQVADGFAANGSRPGAKTADLFVDRLPVNMAVGGIGFGVEETDPDAPAGSFSERDDEDNDGAVLNVAGPSNADFMREGAALVELESEEPTQVWARRV